MINKLIWTAFLLLSFGFAKAQDSTRNSIELNEIEVWVKSVKVTPKTDTAIVQLYLQSYLKNPREFRLNTFSTGLLSGAAKPMWYESIKMGHVVINIKDRQNYLNYLLNRDEPIVLEVKTPSWKKQWGKPKQLKLTFEDYTEEGKFLEFIIDL